MTSPTEGGPGGHPPRHSHVPPSPPKARAKQFSLQVYLLLQPDSSSGTIKRPYEKICHIEKYY